MSTLKELLYVCAYHGQHARSRDCREVLGRAASGKEGRTRHLEKFDNAMRHVGAVKGTEVNETPHAIQAAESRVRNAELAVLAAQTALEEAKRKREEADQNQAVLDRYEHDIELARATSALLRCMRSTDFPDIAFPTVVQDWSTTLAKYRDELLPLAESYGFDIVLVADDTRAELRKTYWV